MEAVLRMHGGITQYNSRTLLIDLEACKLLGAEG